MRLPVNCLKLCHSAQCGMNQPTEGSFVQLGILSRSSAESQLPLARGQTPNLHGPSPYVHLATTQETGRGWLQPVKINEPTGTGHWHCGRAVLALSGAAATTAQKPFSCCFSYRLALFRISAIDEYDRNCEHRRSRHPAFAFTHPSHPVCMYV